MRFESTFWILDSKCYWGGREEEEGRLHIHGAKSVCPSDQNLNNLVKYKKDVINPAK